MGQKRIKGLRAVERAAQNGQELMSKYRYRGKSRRKALRTI